MKHMYKLADAYSFGWDGLEGKSYSSAEDFDRASAATFIVRKRHGQVYNDVSDRIYLVLEGSGWFEIAGNRSSVGATDVVIVPRQTTYDYGGDMSLFLVHSPSFRPETDHDLEHVQGRD